MINWHSSACRRPDVIFLDDIGAPSCLNCGEVGIIDEAPSASAPNEPPETPQRASFELRWPTSLPFIDDVPDNTDSTEQSKPTSPVAGEGFTVGKTPAATDAIKHTSAPAKTSLYETLDARKIRIITLLPGKYHDPIRCKIRTVDLQPKAEYEALSYTWADANGDTSLSQLLYVGDRCDILRITVNCANALRRLRFPGWSRYLWVDAICIDQHDIDERSHQVGIMRYIYATAQRVIIYLGEDAENPDQDVSVPWKYENQGNNLDLSANLSHRPYFTRVWIIQEIASAKSAWIVCGSRGMRWQDFVAVGASDDEATRGNHTQLRQFHPWLALFSRPKIRYLHELYGVIIATSRCRASDPRDKVFALLGLFVDCAQAGLVADYSLNVAQVLPGLTAFLLQENPESWWRIFALVNPDGSWNMPSWSVDWTACAEVFVPESVADLPFVYDLGKKKVKWYDSLRQTPPLIHLPWKLTALRLNKNGLLVMRGFSPFCLSDCSLSDDAMLGPPGVVEGIHYEPFTPLGEREAGLAAARWARRTDKLFVVAGLPQHLMMLRPQENSTVHTFVSICKPPNVDCGDLLIRHLRKEALVMISAWNTVLGYDNPDFWLQPWMWIRIRSTCIRIKASYQDFIAKKMWAEPPFSLRNDEPEGSQFNGFINSPEVPQGLGVTWLMPTYTSPSVNGFKDLMKFILGLSTGENSTFLAQACWIWGTTRNQNGEAVKPLPHYKRVPPWKPEYYQDPSVTVFLDSLGRMLGHTLTCKVDAASRPETFLEPLLGQNLWSLVKSYDSILHESVLHTYRQGRRQNASLEPQYLPETTQIEDEQILLFLHQLLEIESDPFPGDQKPDDGAAWASRFLCMWSVLGLSGPLPDVSRRPNAGVCSNILGLSGVQEPSGNGLETVYQLLFDLARGTEKWLLPFEEIFTSQSKQSRLETNEFSRQFLDFLPFVAKCQWEDIIIG